MVLGQPLDLSIDVRLDQAEDAVGQCFDAEVFHADSRVDGNRIQVTVQSVTPALTAVVRVRSSAIVDEPVLSVNLRSTCGQTTSRRYDFLTDFPVETRSSAVPTVIPAAVTAATPPTPTESAPNASSAPLSVPPSAPAPNTERTSIPAPVPRAVAAPRPPRPAAPAVAARPPAPRPVRAPREQAVRSAPAPAPSPVSEAEATRNKPRLRLDTATVAEDRQVPLKSSAELLSVPTDNAQQRAEATAAWRAMNQLPAENPQSEKDRLRLQALEAEGKALKAQLAKNEEDFRLRLERLESNRYDSNIVYLLLALLAAALLAAAFFWNRARRSVAMVADWSRHNDPQVAEAEAAALASRAGNLASRQAPLEPEYAAPRNPTRPAPLAPAAAIAAAASNVDLDIDESLFQDLKKLNTITLPQSLRSEPARLGPDTPAAGGLARGLSPEDFFDVQQHADFFVSLGQYDQAIDVLKKNIDENIEVSPLAYLELLKIYHTLSRQDDYNRLRENFNRIFNGNVPPFASFNDEGRGLEEYPSALLAIENNWGKPQVLDLIESNLYRTPGESSGPAYDLAAYREFLMLYAVAKTMVRRSGTASADVPTGRVSRDAPIGTAAVTTAATAFVAASLPATPPVSRPPPPSFESSLSAMLLDEPLLPETTVGDSPTQPMLLMADTSMPPAQSASGVDTPSYKQPLDLDLDLDLNLDFSNSELQMMSRSHDVSAPRLPTIDLPESFPATLPPELPVLPELPEAPEASPGFPPSTSLDSNLIEFDLFDPSVEAKISPKSK